MFLSIVRCMNLIVVYISKITKNIVTIYLLMHPTYLLLLMSVECCRVIETAKYDHKS